MDEDDSGTSTDRPQETLESYAAANNLDKSNVKNIIYHIITDSHMLSSLLGGDKQAVPHLRLTRSKWKEIQDKVEGNLEICLNPLGKTRTFLDVDYGGDDEDDPDFVPENVDVTEDVNFDFWEVDPSENLHDFEQEYRTEIDEHYLEFVKSCTVENPTLNTEYDDANDEEYNFDAAEKRMNKKKEDVYEYLDNKSTRVARWEMAALWQDFGIDVHAADAPNRKKTRITPTKPEEPLPKSSVDASVSLLGPKPLRANETETAIIREQFEQHIQLLVQSALGCFKNKKLLSSYNLAVGMLNELATTAEKAQEPASYFFPETFEAISLVNDLHYEKSNVFEVPEFEYQKTPFSRKVKTRSMAPLPHYTKMALIDAKFVHYPSLLPVCGFDYFEDELGTFSTSERVLLAIGLFLLHKMPLASNRNPIGRYQIISEYMLRQKNPNQIRTHIKHCKDKDDKLSKIVTGASKGVWSVITESLMFRHKRVQGPPMSWLCPTGVDWVQQLLDIRFFYVSDNTSNCCFLVKNNRITPYTAFEDGRIPSEAFYKDLKIGEIPYNAPSFTLEAENEAEIGVDDRQSVFVGEPSEMRPHDVQSIASSLPPDSVDASLGASAVNSPHYNTDASNMYHMDVCEGSNSSRKRPHSSVDESPLGDSPLKRPSFAQRKLTTPYEALNNDENRQRAFEGLIAAVQNDINQRFFMHEEKLRKFRAIVSQPDKHPHQILMELKDTLDSVDQEIVFVLATLLNEEDMHESIKNHPQFATIRRVINILIDIQAYLYGTRGLKTLQHIATKLRNENLKDVEVLKNVLRNVFRRDPKLCRIFLPNEPGDNNFPEETFENLSTTDFDAGNPEFEIVDVPYKRPANVADRPLLQIHQGNIVLKQPDNFYEVRIASSPPQWTQGADFDLMKTALRNGFDFQKAAMVFCGNPRYRHFTIENAIQRLKHIQSNTT